jgi:CubicO group peptidase (beta-lactamase class C family)
MSQKVIKKLFIFTIALVLIGTSIIPTITSIVNDNAQELSNDYKGLLSDISLNLRIKLWMKFGTIPALSACIIKNNSIIWSNGFGYYTKGPKLRPSSDTIYLAASISKSITSTAFMQLYENELYNIDLDDDVNDYLDFSLRNPNYPEVPITFRMLLSHHSSILTKKHLSILQFEGFPFSFVEEILTPGGYVYSPDYWGKYQPGTDVNYSNLAFVIIGHIIERITGQSFEDYCQENIFNPLGMDDTSFNLESLDESRLAGHFFRIGRRFLPFPRIELTFFDPAGGLLTTVDDLSRFLIVHMNNGSYGDIKILENSTVELMHMIQYPGSRVWYGYQFGLGWMVIPDEKGERYEGHDGDLTIVHSNMRMKSDGDSGVIVLFNWDSTLYPFFVNLNKLIRNMGGLAREQIRYLLFKTVDYNS